MSTLTIKYFGVIAEITDKNEEEIEVTNEMPLKDLLNDCYDKYPGLKEVSFKVAHNQKMIESGVVRPTDEIALLPPFSGG